jgi:hypothetical protein
MFINRLIQDILALTPFVPPTMDRFYRSADKEGFVSRFPVFGSLLNVVPPLKWIDSKFKYPLLTIGRIIVCGFVVWQVVNFTIYNPDYKTFVNNQVVNRIFPSPVKAVVTPINSGNFITDGFKNQQANAANETSYLIEVAKTGTGQNIVKELFYGATATIFRAPIVFLLYSLLFFIFGNTTSQRDSQALTKISGVRSIGEGVIKNLSAFIDQDKFQLLQKEFKSLTDTQKLYDSDYQKRVVELLGFNKK